MINANQLKQIFPYSVKSTFDLNDIVSALNVAFKDIGADVHPVRAAMFMAQIGEESNQFTAVVEDLEYSAEALFRVFPSHFSSLTQAQEYAYQPEKIANRVYANRLGNGDENSGDGWKYKGRGFIQVTGKTNYTNCGNYLCIDTVNNPSMLAQLPYAMYSAVWYWMTNNLNTYADKSDVIMCTRLINGGENGIYTREQNFELAKKILMV